MIAAWMLFALETSALLFIAAWLAERALTAARRPVRWVWVIAMLGTTILPIAAWFAPAKTETVIVASNAAHNASRVAPTVQSPVALESSNKPNANASAANVASSSNMQLSANDSGVNTKATLPPVASPEFASPAVTSANSNVDGARTSNATNDLSTRPSIRASASNVLAGFPSRVEVAANSSLQRFNSPLLVLWMAIIAFGAMICLFAIWRTWRQRTRWLGEYVDGTPVLVTHDVGPALIGVLQYSIVVPRWVFALEERARKLILAHEREHARSYDPLLLAVGVLLVLVAPWNVVNWLMLRRLRLAVELDCDQRVLHAHPDARGYSRLLLDVAERTLPSVLPQAALVEHGTSLETRIRAMISPSVRHRAWRVGLNGVAMAALVAVACVTPRPYASLPAAERVARLRGDLAEALASEKASSKNVDALRSEKALLKQADSARVLAQRSLAVPDSVGMKATPAGMSAGSSSRSSDQYVVLQHMGKRLRGTVMSANPKAFGNTWSRGDSAVAVLYDANEQIIRQSADPIAPDAQLLHLASYFNKRFPGVKADDVETVGIVNFFADGNAQLLNLPLQVVWGRLKEGASFPKEK